MLASPRSSTGLVERVHVDAASGPFSASQLVQHSKRRQKRPAKALRRMHARQALEQQCQVTRRSGHGLPVGSGVDGGDAPLLDGHCDGPRRTFFEPSGHPPWPRADPADRLIMQNLNLMKWDSPPSCFTRRVHRKGLIWMEYWKFTPKSYYALGPVYASKWEKALKDYREDYREDELTADHDGQYSDLNDFPDDSLATVGYDSDATKDFSSQA